MTNRTNIFLRSLVRFSRPWSLLAGILLYALGNGIAIYLGRQIQWDVYLIGQACITLLQLSSYFLKGFFDTPPDEERRRRRRLDGDEDEEMLDSSIPRSTLMLVAATALTTGAALTVLLYARGLLNLTAFLFLSLGFALAFFYAVPPFSLANRGYGEIMHAVFIANITPAFAYGLQVGELHRLLSMLTFPLTATYLAMSLAISLERYYRDVKKDHQTLMVRVGWQRGMNLHNLMILMAYFLIGLAVLRGLPWSLTWPPLLTLPLGMFQVYQMWAINQGAPPRWRVLRFTATALFALMAYFIAFALWVG